MFFVCVTVALVYLASKYRSIVFRSVKKFCKNITNWKTSCIEKNSKVNEFASDKIILAAFSPETYDYAVQHIRWSRASSENPDNNNTIKLYQGPEIINNGNSKSSSLATRKEPLYHNCYLQAPDGETLCTCDRKKAEWYVSKRLGTVVGENPFTVRLNFEPSGRASGQVGQYYTQIKVNQCVVCGANKKFIKKNVVPREYRKYFPLVMKAHQSHDVLLLCPDCHEVSNRHDLDLRRQLADMCDAPLARPTTHGRGNFNVGPAYAGRDQRECAKFFSAVKALRDEPPTIPPSRRKQLETQILKFTGQREMSQGLLNCLYEQYKNQPSVIEMSSPQQMRCQPHGMKVVRFFTNRDGGLVTLERMWREHFLQTMRPQYLPKLWSVSHNQERLEIRQTQSRIEPNDAKLAGLTE